MWTKLNLLTKIAVFTYSSEVFLYSSLSNKRQNTRELSCAVCLM